jgi:hypothetical protein
MADDLDDLRALGVRLERARRSLAMAAPNSPAQFHREEAMDLLAAVQLLLDARAGGGLTAR